MTDQTVFIVDDDPAARALVAALVTSRGLPVAEFSSAEDFLARYQKEQKGCLVVDVRMTGMTGIELQAQLNSENAALPVIVITGYADVPTAVRAMQAGAVTFLEKPCKPQELWNSIERALKLEVSRRELQGQISELQERLKELSSEERIVMGMVVKGVPNKKIAADLGIGLRTVELHRSSAIKTMQASSLAELVRMSMMVNFTPHASEEHSHGEDLRKDPQIGTE